MNYLVTKEGVYLHEVYCFQDLLKAEECLVDKVNEDHDDYHEWSIVAAEEGVEVSSGKVLYFLTKPVDGSVVEYDRSISSCNPVRYKAITLEDISQYRREEV